MSPHRLIHVNTWSLVSDAVWEDYCTFSRRRLTGLGWGFENLPLLHLLFALSLSLLPVCAWTMILPPFLRTIMDSIPLEL